MPSRALRFGLFPVLLCLVAAGCGGEKRYRISGKVTYKGAPVPAGKIYFSPDTKKGGSGPDGFADIKDGQYDTDATGGKGSAGGPMLVKIEGYDPNQTDKNDKSGENNAKSLFPPYQTTVDLPKEVMTKDFDVPVAKADAPPPGGAPAGGNLP